MASEAQILQSLRMVAEYYQQELNETQVRLWVQLLMPYAIESIDEALLNHVAHSKWYPRISEIREMCEALDEKYRETYDYLRAELIELSDAFYQERQLDVDAWEAVILKFEKANRVYRAESAREHLAFFKSVLDKEQEQCEKEKC